MVHRKGHAYTPLLPEQHWHAGPEKGRWLRRSIQVPERFCTAVLAV
jgi:hypothetical protein